MLNIGEICVLDNKSNEQEPARGSPSKSNTPSKQNMRFAEVPKIGMKFDCDDSAYEFYKEYAHRIGFSVRKHLVKRAKSGLVKRRTFCCSKEGKRVIDKRRKEVYFHHPISRVGCLAQMTCQLQKDGMLEVVSFHEQHNHEFAPSPMKHMLRSTRQITSAQKDAKVGTTKDYCGIDINANSQELIGKRYSHLSHIFHEISTLAAKNEMTYEYVDRCSKKLLKNLQEMRKRCYFSGVEGQLEVQGEVDNRFESNEDVSSQAIHGIKTKATIKSPKRRLKGALERRKFFKYRTKTTLTSTCISDLQQHARGARQVQSLECLSKDSSIDINSQREQGNIGQEFQLSDNLTQV